MNFCNKSWLTITLAFFFNEFLRMCLISILRKATAVRMIEFVLIFVFIKTALFDTVFIDDVFVNNKFYCEKAMKQSFIAKSQIQCVHLCLSKICTLINYNLKENDKENCEIFTESGTCSLVLDQKNWIAMAVLIEVNLFLLLTLYHYEVDKKL